MSNIAERIEEIESEHGVSVKVTGGGKGWTANAWKDGEIVQTAKATSKAEAVEVLAAALEESDEDDEAGDIEEIEGCADECQSSESAFCQCKCEGMNHGALVGRKAPATMIGPKPCKCGCGELTKRTFVAGHDARYHGLLALRKWAAEQGLTGDDESLRKAKAAAMRKAARERRAEQRAAEAEAVKSAPTSSPKRTRKVRAQVAEQVDTDLRAILDPAGTKVIDDLPF